MDELKTPVLAGKELVRDAEARLEKRCRDQGKPHGEKLESKRNFNYQDIANMTEEEAHMYANG